MEWYNILVLLLGGFGGISGVISLYHAKSNKDTIDIKNLHSIIEEERKEREGLLYFTDGETEANMCMKQYGNWIAGWDWILGNLAPQKFMCLTTMLCFLSR